MEIIKDNFSNLATNENLCIALGTFDGIHLGHKEIIKSAVNLAKEKGIKSAVLTFDTHPLSVILPNTETKVLTDLKTKACIIDELGVDYLLILKFDAFSKNIEAEDFIEFLTDKLNAKALVCGYNYNFGKNKIGTSHLLKELMSIYNYDLLVIDKFKLSNAIVSSSTIRNLIMSGDINTANKLLGHNYFYFGKVAKGKALARNLGFPTANIMIPNNLCLKNGVYLTKTYINNESFLSISNVGNTPTVKRDGRVLETHILNFTKNIYDLEIKIEFVDFLREEKKFDSLEKLKEQMSKDVAYAINYFNL